MDWTFEQMEGPVSDRKKLVLSGWAAPFGRPRKEPVMKETIKARVQTTRYPGGSAQTRHAFGVNLEPMELKGRWMSKVLDKTANEVADDWSAFVRDQRTIRISWGNIVSWQGFIDELELARESADEIAWKLHILLDDRDDKVKPPMGQLEITDAIPETIEAALAAWANLGVKKIRFSNDLTPDFLESLDNLAAAMNQPAAILAKIANQIDSIEKKTYSTLQHFRGATANMKQGILQMRETVLNTQIDSVMLIRSAGADSQWAQYQGQFDVDTMTVLHLLAQADRKAELQQKKEGSKFITAREGDTWETMATRATGSPDKAAALRALNGAAYADQPQPGESYLVP